MDPATVVITGGSGFLAQHLIRELEKHWEEQVKEIRLVDITLFNQFLDFDTKIPLVQYSADCTNITEPLEQAIQGATVVFHLAAKKYHFSNIPQDANSYKANNVSAVENIILLMCRHSVTNLIHVSDALACVGKGEIFGPSECITLDAPPNWQLGIYGKTKFQSEEIVRNCNGRLLHNGGGLRTVTLRPGILYGEGDSGLVPHAIRLCKKFGCLPVVGCGNGGNMQLTYAGNAAAALIQAWRKLEKEPTKFSGEVFFCTEDSGYTHYYNYVLPFIELAGYKESRIAVPYYLASFSTWILDMLTAMTGLKLCGEDFPNCQMIQLGAAWGQGFSNLKTRILLDFCPPYNSEQAMEKTIAWWARELDESRAEKASDQKRKTIRG